MMNKLVVTAFTLFLTLGFAVPCALAQDNTEGPTGATGDADTRVVIEWGDINVTLAPLETITLAPPQLSLGTNGERQTYLQVGETAPWAGILFNPAAIAFIISEYQASFERAGAALDRQRESDSNRLHFEVEQLQLQLLSDRQQADIVIDGQNREIERLTNIHVDYVEEQTGGFWKTGFGEILKWGLVIVGSVAVGIIAGFLIGVTQ